MSRRPQPQRRPHLAFSLIAITSGTLLGCPSTTVEILEAQIDGPELTVDDDFGTDHFRLKIDTPGDAYPGEFSYDERVRIIAQLNTDSSHAGRTDVSILVADIDNNTDNTSHGDFQRAALFVSNTELVIELRLHDCGENRCIRTLDIDFLKSGSGPVHGTWRVEHSIDWLDDDDGDPPAAAETTLVILDR